MEGGAGRGLECQKTTDGKASNGNGLKKDIPSCCLKARASVPELEAKCHSTVVSGWFSSISCNYLINYLSLCYDYLSLAYLLPFG